VKNSQSFLSLEPLKTAVLFLIFSRIDTTKQVFETIRLSKPPRLYIAGDGARENREEEADKVRAVREYVMSRIDWKCKVLTLFREKNLGCKYAVSGAVNWFFENEEKGIILEDDALPHSTFFRFCEELLEYYKDDKRIMMISGDNLQFGRKSTEYSYYFSRYALIWGWASWRRAWNHYDIDMKLWPKIRDNRLLSNILGIESGKVSYWSNIFEKVYKGQINTWDYQWLFACWLQNSLVVMPEVNLISNIGFGNDSTHTKYKSILANLESKPIIFPLSHPPYMVRNVIADRLIGKYLYGSSRIYKKIINLIYGN